MVSDAIKKYRDMFAFGLLAVAVLYLISGVSLLVKSEDDTFLSFTGRAATIGYLFTHPFVIVALATAVALAVGFGQASASARAIVVSALVISGLSLVLGLVTWFAGFAYDGSGFGGVFMAGKIVAIFLGLAQLLAMGLVLFFSLAAFQTLPKRVRQTQQWGGYQQGQQQWGQQPPPGQQQWGQQPPQQWGQQAPQGQQQWGQPSQQQWAQPEQQWQQPEQQQQHWGQPEHQQTWGQHVEQQPTAWAQPDQQQTWGQHAQPASAWSTPETQSETQQPDAAQPEQQAWGQPEQQAWGQPEQQQSWGQPAGHEAQSWAPSETSEADQTAVSDAVPTDSDSPLAGSELPEETAADEQSDAGATGDAEAPESQQDGWWQRPSP